MTGSSFKDLDIYLHKESDTTMKQYSMTIDKPAKNMGGDRYVISDTGKSIYVPQELSREGGASRDDLVLHLNTSSVSDTSEITMDAFTLLRKATSTGDDRYTPGPNNVTWNGDIYLPCEMRVQTIYVGIAPLNVN
jgi:hypothetical protein